MSKVNTVTVWHANNPTWRTSDSPAWNPDNYTMVAIIAADSETGGSVELETAYYLTQHLSHHWWENEGVTLVSEKTRSTSVGDVIFRDGKPYMVASFGFDEIQKPEALLGLEVN
jgi:hypothetical protein